MLNPVLADAHVFLDEKQNWQNEAQAGLCVSTPSSRTELAYLGINSDETQIQHKDALVHSIPLWTVTQSSDPYKGQILIIWVWSQFDREMGSYDSKNS